MWPALLPILGNLLEKFLPDPKQAAEAKLKMLELAQAGELKVLDADLQMALGQIALHLRPVDLLLQQSSERFIVEQRSRPQPFGGQHPADAQHRHPARAGDNHVGHFGAVDLLHMEVGPHLNQPVDACGEIMGTTGQHGGIDGTRRCATDDRKRISGALTMLAGEIGNGGEHTHLVGRTRTTTTQDETNPLFHGAMLGQLGAAKPRYNTGEARQFPRPQRLRRQDGQRSPKPRRNSLSNSRT